MMGWEHIIATAEEYHFCPTPTPAEWRLKQAEVGSTWRCDGCNVLWRLSSMGESDEMTYWAADDEAATENSL